MRDCLTRRTTSSIAASSSPACSRLNAMPSSPRDGLRSRPEPTKPAKQEEQPAPLRGAQRNHHDEAYRTGERAQGERLCERQRRGDPEIGDRLQEKICRPNQRKQAEETLHFRGRGNDVS